MSERFLPREYVETVRGGGRQSGKMDFFMQAVAARLDDPLIKKTILPVMGKHMARDIIRRAEQRGLRATVRVFINTTMQRQPHKSRRSMYVHVWRGEK
jgi:hypothetical protein